MGSIAHTLSIVTSSGLILAGSAVYVLGLLLIGMYSAGKVADAADFVVAGRKLPLWLCTFTLYATFFGAGTCIGAAGAAYSGGLQAVIADPFGAGLCLILAGAFYVRFLRRMKLLTVADYFRQRFGSKTELLAAFCVFPAYIGWVASQFFAFGIILNSLTGIETGTATVIGAVVVLIYTVAGGMWAVSMTDFVQGIVLILGIFVLLPYLLADVGGLSGLVAQSPPGSFDLLPENTLKDWLWYLQAWLVIGIGNIPGQDLFQRALSAKSEAVAQWSAYIAGAMYFTVGLVPVLLGIGGALVIPDLADPEQILLALGLKYLSPVAMAIFVGALFSALMSSADSALLAPASIFGQNVLKNLWPDIHESQLLRSIRWSVIGFGILGLAIALHFKTVYDLMVNSWSVLMVSLFVPMTAGIYWKKTNAAGAAASIVGGVASWLVLMQVQEDYPADLLATGIAVLLLVAVTLATHASSPPTDVRDLDGNELSDGNRLGVLPWSSLARD